MNRLRFALVIATATAIASAVYGVALDFTMWGGVGTALTVAAGWTFVVGGAAAWWRRPESLIGRTMIATGAAWWLTIALGTRSPILWTSSYAFELVFFPLLLFTFLAYPTGRLGWIVPRAVVASAVAAEVIGYLAAIPFFDPGAHGCGDCPSGLNMVLISDKPTLNTWLNIRIAGSLIIVSLIGSVALLIVRWIRATRPARRVLAPTIVPAAIWSLAYLAYISFQQLASIGVYGAPTAAYVNLLRVFVITLIIMPATYLIGLSRYRARRARVSELVLELGDLPASERLEDALRRTLGDTALRLGFRVGEGYVTADGRPLQLPEDDETRTATFLEREGVPLAAIVHDRALLDDPGLLDAVSAAARLAVENERLQAEVRAQLEEVRASRTRIVEAADSERRRMERDLHDGAQTRLVSLSLALQAAESKLDERADPEVRRSLQRASEELGRALIELRELARGIHPPILAGAGLGAALEALAERAPLPVRIVEAPDDRLPPKVEGAAYFIVSEAIANAAKHASATEATVRASSKEGTLTLEVVDDGRGGADAVGGSGLRGLSDRVEALDGELSVDSPPGRGTRIVARLPCA
jgi:signal transduction histidine kinase